MPERARRRLLSGFLPIAVGGALPLVAMAVALVGQLTSTALPACGSAAPHRALLDGFPTGVKPVSMGLLMRGPAAPPASLAGAVSGYIIEERWDVAQPTGPSDFVTSNIDSAVAKVRAWNAQHPSTPEFLRMRIETGVYAPDWVKAMDGGPVPVRSPAGASGTVARWWDADVQDAYTSFVAKLAAHVDVIPEIREVTVGLTMEFFGEIFVRFPQQNGAALQAAGFTQQADLAAMEASFRANLPFRQTTTQIDVNAYEQLNGSGSLAITQQMMDYALSIGLAHVQFANASLDVSGNDSLYALMQSYGPKGDQAATLTFQSMPNVANVTAVGQRAVSFGATSLELPNALGTLAELNPLASALSQNLGSVLPGGQVVVGDPVGAFDGRSGISRNSGVVGATRAAGRGPLSGRRAAVGFGSSASSNPATARGTTGPTANTAAGPACTS